MIVWIPIRAAPTKSSESRPALRSKCSSTCRQTPEFVKPSNAIPGERQIVIECVVRNEFSPPCGRSLDKHRIDLDADGTRRQSLQNLTGATAKVDRWAMHIVEDVSQVETLDESAKRAAAAAELFVRVRLPELVAAVHIEKYTST